MVYLILPEEIQSPFDEGDSFQPFDDDEWEEDEGEFNDWEIYQAAA